MNLNYCKEKILAGVCSITLLGVSPQAFAAGDEAPLPQAAQQADKKITGTVSDAMGPVIGASILVKGTSTGTVTDFDGKFSLQAKPGATLVVSYIGYVTKEVKVGQQNAYNITLEEDKQVLDEVVVVGYGTMKKSDLSGASVSLGENAIKGSIITSLDQSLQGRAAGVSAVQTSGAPGSASSIRVRGTATINANAEPLYVIDGVIVRGNDRGESGAAYGLGDALGNGAVSTISPLSTIDPADIVSMEILKDASATAIYGAQGANGVVLITTKHGKAGEAKFSYSGMVAASRQNKRLDMMNLREYAQFYNSMYQQGEVATANAYLSDPSVLGRGTNWQDAVFQTAWQHSHQVSAQGGTEKVQYYVSGSYMNQEGTIIGSKFDRLSFRANIDAELKKWLKMGVNIAYSNSNDDLKLADSEEGLITYSLTTIPSIPIYDIDGEYSSISQEGYTNPNPIAMAMSDDILLNRQKLNGNIFFDVKFFEGLVWHTELGFDVNASKGETYEPMISLGTWKRTTNSSSWNKNSGTFLQFKNYLTWNKTFVEKHSVTGMVGQEAWESKYDYVQVSNTNLPSDEVHSPNLGQGTQSFSNGFGSSAMASFFTRWTYGYDNRYNATYTYRYDGSSNFGPNKRWAGFHSFAASWRFSNEKFFHDALGNIVSNGKLRVGWGQTGNSNIGGFKWGVPLSKMESDFGVTYRPAQIANKDIKWESQEQWNVGLDLGFLNDRINLTVDWYIKESRDMLMKLNLPSIMGTQGNGSSALAAPWGNYGHIRNTGLEISLNTHPIRGQFTWDSDFQISFNKNKLISLSDGATSVALTGYGQWTDVVSYTKEGEALYNFYGYVCDGVYEDLEDLETSPKPEAYPSNGVFSKGSSVWVGDIKYKDLNGDGVINESDRTVIGNPLPKYTFGWNNSFSYKNFDLNIFINGSVGGKIGNYNKMKLTHMNSSWTNQLTDVNDRAILEPINPNKDYSAGVDRGDGQLVWAWYDDVTNVHVANDGTSTPRASINDPNDNDRWSDRYIEDGSYVRLKNVSLGYTFPKKLIQPFGIENLRLSCNIQNLCTISGYSGYDPEVGASTTSANVFGLDNGRYPSPTTYSFALNVSF